MLIRKRKGWEMPESAATPEHLFMERREFLKTIGGYSIGAGLLFSGMGEFFNPFGRDKSVEGGEGVIEAPLSPTAHLYPARRNGAFVLERALTGEDVAAMYNNFYEFSSGKSVYKLVSALKTRPWTLEVAGLVEKPFVMDIDELVRKMPLEERLYRLRCVEAWAMAVPWTGFPMREFIKLAKPLSSARFVRFQTFYNKGWAPEQKRKFWLPWPYEEGLTMEEAGNELTMLVTGIYGHELPKQHGAPIRLIVPWKYGFKSIKSVVRIEFTEKMPRAFWPALVPDEYDFLSNVNPEVPHPRWSQATEKMLGTGERRPTVKYNGYGEFVAGIYKR